MSEQQKPQPIALPVQGRAPSVAVATPQVQLPAARVPAAAAEPASLDEAALIAELTELLHEEALPAPTGRRTDTLLARTESTTRRSIRSNPESVRP